MPHRLPALVAVLCLVALCCGCQPRPGMAAPEPEDLAAPALVVGDAVLTVGQVAPVLEHVLQPQALLVQGLPVDSARDILTGILEAAYKALADEQLLLAEARRRGLTVDEAVVDSRIEALRQGLPEIYRMAVEIEGLESYRAKLKLLLLRQETERVIVAEQAALCPPGDIPDGKALLERWLVLARAGTPIEILWRPNLLPYLPSSPPQGGGG